MVNSLEIDSVQLNFASRKILQSIYLKAETGRITGIVGRNGCGKSSLLRVLFGDISAGESSIRINGTALVSSYRSPSDMRMLPYFSFVPPNLRISAVFDDYEIDFVSFCEQFSEFRNHENRRIRELSGGNIRTIEVYIILKSRTRFCLLDEPFTHLSPKNVEIFTELIKEEKKNKGVIVTDHQYRSILDVSDDLYLLVNGTTYRATGESDLVRFGYLPSAGEL